MNPVRLATLDAAAGGSVGVFLVAAATVLGPLADVPVEAVRLNGAVNLAYAGLGLALRPSLARHPARLRVLAVANLLWTVCCALLLVRFAREIGWLAIAHVTAEGLVCAALGVAELRAAGASADAV